MKPRAGAGDHGIVPGSMGTESYIVRGLGNAASFDVDRAGVHDRRQDRHARVGGPSGTHDLQEGRFVAEHRD